MSSKLAILNSSIGKKVLMSLTGLFLIAFLLVHLMGNLQLLKSDEGLSFNSYALFMTTNPLIKFISYGLYAFIVIHAFKGLALAYENKGKRAVKYAVDAGASNSHWTSRNMGIVGTVLLVFIVVHMSGFWYKYKFGVTPWTKYKTELVSNQTEVSDVTGEGYVISRTFYNDTHEIVIAKDLYKEVLNTYQNEFFVIFYVLCMFAVAFHLWHGFESAFQTLGINHPRYTPMIKFTGRAFSVLVSFGFAIIPLYMYFFL
jgi:succinate dehydrogenase / fumarate reductase cytochrome b subunit